MRMCVRSHRPSGEADQQVLPARLHASTDAPTRTERSGRATTRSRLRDSPPHDPADQRPAQDRGGSEDGVAFGH